MVDVRWREALGFLGEGIVCSSNKCDYASS
jgi:hypothetical protein